MNNILNKNSIDYFYGIAKYPDHEKLKEKVLPVINNSEYELSLDGNLKTDYWLDKEQEWINIFFKDTISFVAQCFLEMGYNQIFVSKAWFQQYSKQGEHGWHCHRGTNFSVVYYLDMPNDTSRTTIFQSKDSSTIDVAGEEGTFYICPSHIIHKVKPNKVEKKRTVIAFNVDIEYLDNHLMLD